MSGSDRSQRTEAPTPKRKREARRRGQVAKTQELTAWGGLLLATFLLQVTCSTGARRLSALMRQVQAVIERPDGADVTRVLAEGLTAFLVTLAPLALGLLVAGVTIELVQVGGRVTPQRLKPKFERLNVFKGLKQMFSTRSLWETAKGVLKIAIVALVAYPAVADTARELAQGGMGVWQIATLTAGGVLSLVRSVALVGLVLAAADYIVQKRRVLSDLRMTKQEVKEEMRQSEGDPHMRGAVRSRQLSMGRNRMLAAVANADVVLVNPTHYAVALRYRADRGAPEVVAKGAGVVAAGIRARAEEHLVPLVEDPPLTRALHRVCDVGALIPADLYEAVARVLAFVFALRRVGRRGGTHRVPGPGAAAAAHDAIDRRSLQVSARAATVR
jgi:flagellar biosynthetic protein FlhB